MQMSIKNSYEIKLQEGTGKRYANQYGYDLIIINKTIKDKKGYFVKVDKNTFGPFAKIIMHNTKPDEDRFMICMANAIDAFVVRIGVKGFEIVEKLDYSDQAVDYLKTKNMAKHLENVRKISTNGQYVIYQTDDQKLFVELKGVPLTDLSKYKMFDSYKELYLYHLIKYNDNTLFDTNARFSQYSPKIFIAVGQRLRGKLSKLDEDQIHKKQNALDCAKLELSIINAIKSKYDINQLRQIDDVAIWYNKNNLFTTQAEIDRFDLEKIVFFNKYNEQFCVKLDDFDCSYGANEIVIKIGPDYYVYENNELKHVNYIFKDIAKEILTERAGKLCQEQQIALDKRIDELNKSFTKKELDYLDFYTLRRFAMRYKNLDSCEELSKGKTIKQIKEKLLALTKELNMSILDKKLLINELYNCILTKKDFVNNVNHFVEMIKSKYPDEAYIILRRRWIAFDRIYFNDSFSLCDKIKYMFAGLKEADLLAISSGNGNNKNALPDETVNNKK